MDSSVIVFCLGLLWLWFRKVHFQNESLHLVNQALINYHETYVSLCINFTSCCTCSNGLIVSLIRFSQNTSAWFWVFDLNILWLKIDPGRLLDRVLVLCARDSEEMTFSLKQCTSLHIIFQRVHELYNNNDITYTFSDDALQEVERLVTVELMQWHYVYFCKIIHKLFK